MKTWVALLRGINVGGKNKVLMAEFRDALGRAGFTDVQTYIQSGNVVLTAAKDMSRDDVKARVQSVLSEAHGVEADVMVLTPGEIAAAAKRNPLLAHMDKPNWMFVSFLSGAPDAPDMDTLEDVKSENEHFALDGAVFYFYAGDGAARSKVLMKAEKALGVSATARNWNTVQKLLSMTGETDG